MSVKAIVSQQSHKVYDLIDMFVIICFIGDKDLPCN